MHSWRNHTSFVSIGNPARSLSNTGGGICKRSNTGERRAKIIQILSSDVVSVFNFFLKHEVQEWEKAARNSSNKSLYHRALSTAEVGCVLRWFWGKAPPAAALGFFPLA